MNAEIFTLCDYAADYGQGKLNVIGTFDQVNAPALPFSLPQCAVAARLRIGNHEAGKHRFEIRFLDSDGESFQNSISGDLDVKPNLHADYTSINIPINIAGLTFKKAGKHGIELYWEGEFVSGLTLNVHMQAAGQAR